MSQAGLLPLASFRSSEKRKLSSKQRSVSFEDVSYLNTIPDKKSKSKRSGSLSNLKISDDTILNTSTRPLLSCTSDEFETNSDPGKDGEIQHPFLTNISGDRTIPSSSDESDNTLSPMERQARGSVNGYLELMDNIPMKEGEKLYFKTAEASVVYISPFGNPITGFLYITDYKVYFRGGEDEQATKIQIPLGCVTHAEKVGGKRSRGEYAYGLDIICKDFRSVQLALKITAEYSRNDIVNTICRLAFISNCPNGQFFAFRYKPTYPGAYRDGWKQAEIKKDYQRLNIPNGKWRFTESNKKYNLCETYSKTLVVPEHVTDEELRQVATFRSKNRIPVLSWCKSNGACLCRSSQPLPGRLNRRSGDDEQYLQSIMRTNHKHMLYLFDARPKVNAQANSMMGGGYEQENHYLNMNFRFLDIPNIHVMRESQRKLFELCFNGMDNPNWFTKLEDTRWLEYIRLILDSASKIVYTVDRLAGTVLIHCSDGWDRTAQLTSLAQLMLDPYYRTIEGFEMLIQKEWLSFGHKFSDRIGHGKKNHLDEQRSPVFLQFMDCVWQMIMQFPFDFEFNEKFLLTILQHLYSCLYGTFLFNCERERTNVYAIDVVTESLWTYVNCQKDIYTNVLYQPQQPQRVLYPVASIRKLELWTNYFMQWNPRMKPQDAEVERCKDLEEIIKVLKKKCAQLEDELRKRKTAGDLC